MHVTSCFTPSTVSFASITSHNLRLLLTSHVSFFLFLSFHFFFHFSSESSDSSSSLVSTFFTFRFKSLSIKSLLLLWKEWMTIVPLMLCYITLYTFHRISEEVGYLSIMLYSFINYIYCVTFTGFRILQMHLKHLIIFTFLWSFVLVLLLQPVCHPLLLFLSFSFSSFC